MNTDQLRFDGEVAIVTGATRGIGAAHARMLAARGARVVLNDLAPRAGDDGASVEAVAAEIAETSAGAVAVTGSITDDATRTALVESALDNFGRVDIIVNNAGIGVRHPVGELVAKHLQLEYDVHVVGAMMLVNEAWPHLSVRGGSVVSTTSGVGLFGMAGGSVGYAAAKMALLGANRVLAIEGRPFGIRSNLVAPSADTRMAGDVFGDLTQLLRPEYISTVVTWLSHPSCSLTGEVLSAAGGRVARVATTVGEGKRMESPEQIAANWESLLGDEQVELSDALDEMRLTAQVLGRS